MRTPPNSRFPYLNPTSAPHGARWPLGFSHRGDAPNGGENTLEAFRSAVERGFGYLELDVRTTRDGVVMVFHDETLERVSTGTGRLEDHTYDDIRRLDVDGRAIPRFEDVLAAWPDVRLNVDLKDEQSVVPFAALLNQYRAHDRVLVASFSDVRRRRVLGLLDAPAASSPGRVTIAAAVLLGKVGLMGLLRPWLASVAALQVPERHGRLRVVTPRFIAQAHRAGLQVHVWVVNDRADMDRLLDLGVDGLLTDRADVLAAVLAARGCWPQRGGTGTNDTARPGIPGPAG
ncbi:glycerophosphodiester phosphodiesterase [Arthrobacter sp. JSM 101049]|uniref:glycerophosphodiester phosphodiesterase n=1 Tax=Arthrobacter sp. JSM 101049 TaxID=929097 RepID=UPI003568F9A3